MKKHQMNEKNKNDAASINWNGLLGTPQETLGSIAKTLSTRLRLWAVEDVDMLTGEDEMDFDDVGVHKTAIFLIIPAARQTYKAVANIFYSQLFERLMYIAMVNVSFLSMNYQVSAGEPPELITLEVLRYNNSVPLRIFLS